MSLDHKPPFISFSYFPFWFRTRLKISFFMIFLQSHESRYFLLFPFFQAFFQLCHQISCCCRSNIHFFRLKLDRKSTRLNSSHVAISCAVSCLTKTSRKSVRRPFG